MRIRRLKLSGFKSFVEPAELRIEPGLTGVVGPNGCGKSNLLEAIRWVMGEASPKSLRGGGMEDVIFAGTASRPPRDFAEVSVLLDRESNDGELGESEVTRRIERGAGSAYRIDGRDVRAKDVSLLFADASTGAHSPALVSQGRIGAVIAAKPVERRQMLEEAAGISGLHVRRKDAEQKLRATEANLARLDELLSEQEARAAALKRQARAAERYRQLSDRIHSAEARLLFARWAEADARAQAAAGEAREAAAEVARLQDALAQLSAAQEQARQLLAERREASLGAREQGTRIAHALATARARRDTVIRRLVELDRLDSSLAAETQRELSLKDDAVRNVELLEAERQAIEQRLGQSEREELAIARALTQAEEAARASDVALAELLARDAAMRAERRVAEAALTAAKAQLQRVEQDRARVEQQLGQLDSGDQWRSAAEAAEQQQKQAVADNAAAEQSLAAAESARAKAAARRDDAESRLAGVRAALSAAVAEADALTRALQQGGQDSLVALLQVEAGYEAALAAALGEDADAEVQGEGLRRWMGAAIEPGDPPLADGLEPISRFVAAPAELGRRLEQVGFAEADRGQPLAVGQRLVTRDGLMRRWDGFVSVGGGAAAAERLVRVNRLASLRQKRPGLEQDVTDAQAGQRAAEAEIETQRQAANAAREALATADRQARDTVRAADAAASALERIATQRNDLEQRLTELQPLHAAATEVLVQAEQAFAALPESAALELAVVDAREKATAAGAMVAERRADAATRARLTATDRERHVTAGKDQAAWRDRAAAADQRLLETAERARTHAEEREQLSGQPEQLALEIEAAEQESARNDVVLADAQAAERTAEVALAEAGTALATAGETLSQARERRAGASARAEGEEARRAEYARISGERFECPPPLLPGRFGFDPSELRAVEEESAILERLSADRERLGPVNLVAEQELSEIEDSRIRSAAEREELATAIHRLRGSIGSLNREGRTRLLDAYEKVDGHFRSLFTTLFDGGQAHLELVESDDPLEAGLEIMAQPPGKRLTALTLLSGGEQALTAVALIFALFLTNPAPICVLDEVDAPLDDANVERFCDLLARMSAQTDTRYLIVTHNAVTMSRMHRLYGVTMVEKGVSRLVSVDLGGAETLLAAE